MIDMADLIDTRYGSQRMLHVACELRHTLVASPPSVLVLWANLCHYMLVILIFIRLVSLLYLDGMNSLER